MSRKVRLVAQSFGDGDYSIVRTTVNKYPKCVFESNESAGNKVNAVVIQQEKPVSD